MLSLFLVALSSDIKRLHSFSLLLSEHGHILESYVCAWVYFWVVPLCSACTVCVCLSQSTQPLWKPNVRVFSLDGLNALFVFENTCLNPAWSWLDVFSQLSRWLQALIPRHLHRNKALAYILPAFFHSNTWQKLRWQFWCELIHLTSQPTFGAAYKELSFWITFLPFWEISVPAEHFTA